jgi:hypothetical protein
MIKIITACDDNPRYVEMSEICQSSIKKYCTQHSLSFSFRQIPENDRRAVWYKIKFLKEELETGSEEYCLWIDTDAIIYNRNFDLKTLTASGREIYLSKDILGLNTGVMLFKKSDFNIRLLDKIWGMTHCFNHPWQEQQALIELVESNYEDIQKKLEFVPQKILNSYVYEMHGKRHAEGEFYRHSFVVHFPNLPYKIRIRSMKFLNNVSDYIYRPGGKLRPVLFGAIAFYVSSFAAVERFWNRQRRSISKRMASTRHAF